MPEFEKKHSSDYPRNSKSSDYEKTPQRNKKRKKQNIFVGILSGLLPWKGDTIGNIARKLVFLASLILIVFASFYIIHFYFIRDIELGNELQKWDEYKNNYSGDDRITINMPADKEDGEESGEEKNVEVIGEYLGYYETNSDFVGYVSIYPIIQYPVVQSNNNEFYLEHNFEKVPTANGTIFADWECEFTPATRPPNIIIYGHNLITKHFFQPLKYYRESMDYLIEHPTVQFDTLYERGTYKIFSVFLTNTLEMHGEVFDYWSSENMTFKSKSHFDNYIAECIDRSYYYTGVDMQYGDEILILSTCDFSMFSDMRLVVAARRVRDNESPVVDTSLFVDNSGRQDGYVQRKMFTSYYETFAPSGWAGRNWDTSCIKDFNG